MAIEIGDTLLMTQYGVENVVEACSPPDAGLVQIKSKGVHSPCPVGDLHEPWILHDPDKGNLKDGGPIYVKPDGQMTDDKKEAKLFRSPDDAEAFRDGFTGIPYFKPAKYKDCT